MFKQDKLDFFDVNKLHVSESPAYSIIVWHAMPWHSWLLLQSIATLSLL